MIAQPSWSASFLARGERHAGEPSAGPGQAGRVQGLKIVGQYSDFFQLLRRCANFRACLGKKMEGIAGRGYLRGDLQGSGLASETSRRIVSFAGFLPVARMPNDN